MNASDAWVAYERNRRPTTNLSTAPRVPGVYAFFWRDGVFPHSDIAPFVEAGRLLYVGKAENSLFQRLDRQHLREGRTRSSTLRRTLGALLRTTLALEVIARDDSFQFDEDGERRLTGWMRDNLDVTWAEVPGGADAVRRVEDDLVRARKPLLNLAGNPESPIRAIVDAARRECRQTAGCKTDPDSSAPRPRIVGPRANCGLRTQRVTPNDLKRGQIRIPAATKPYLPDADTALDVRLRGKTFCDVRYRVSPNRSGVLSLGRENLSDIAANDVLDVAVEEDGLVIMD